MTSILIKIVAQIAVRRIFQTLLIRASTHISWLFIWNSDPNDETSTFHLNNLEERSSLSSFTIRVQPTVEEFDEDSPELS